MNEPSLSSAEEARSRLRATVSAIEREISHLPRTATAGDGVALLNAAFSDLVKQLDLGPEPELRACPVCQHMGMRTATLCGHCWTKLTPPA